MALTVKIKSETDVEIELKATRVDQRITVTPIVTERAGQETVNARAGRSRRMTLFIITGRATQSEKDAIETANRTWWRLGSGALVGRIRFYWGENLSGNPYGCAITKTDFWKESGKKKYDYLMELVEGAF